MKRSLRIVDEADKDVVAEPLAVGVGARVLIVTDTGDGKLAQFFVDGLRREGADASRLPAELTESPDDISIVIRSPSTVPKARVRGEDLERQADVILGSARAAFARHLLASLHLRRLG